MDSTYVVVTLRLQAPLDTCRNMLYDRIYVVFDV